MTAGDYLTPTRPPSRILERLALIIGERVLGLMPSLRQAAALVRASHERWDGTGYPDQLAGDQVPVGARIVSVADAFAA